MQHGWQEGQEVVALWRCTLPGSDSVKKKKKEGTAFNMEMTESKSWGVSEKGKSSV